jgi:predicted nucleic acid-binding protein
VLDEYQAKAPPTEPDLSYVPWLKVVDDVIIVPALPLLDAGEAAAISLAQTVGAQLILLDERKARRIAARMGLPIAGTLAVLLRAKQHKLIAAVRPYPPNAESGKAIPSQSHCVSPRRSWRIILALHC